MAAINYSGDFITFSNLTGGKQYTIFLPDANGNDRILLDCHTQVYYHFPVHKMRPTFEQGIATTQKGLAGMEYPEGEICN